MSLKPGTRLGPYEILAPLGAGGMGEVYRASDTRLGRIVAIKVLSGQLSRSAESKSRFEREARAISSLNHPNICTVHDFGEATVPGDEIVDYLVMEFIEGESLAARIARGPLPIGEVIRLGIQICEALARAHRQGIVHRDLKPGNVMLTRTGVKLVDFGLAKAVGPSETSQPDAPTQEALTTEGAIVGTLNYMAPEQLEGGAVDVRTDIFALGATLREMATGQRTFSGGSRASIIASILREEPPSVRTIRGDIPPALEETIAVCLVKDPEMRWQSAQDVAIHLRLLETRQPEKAPEIAAPGAGQSSRWPLRAVAAGLVAGAAITFAALWVIWRPLSRSVATEGSGKRAYLALSLPHPMPISTFSFANTFDLSRDGSRIVFVANEGTRRRLYVRSLDSAEAKPIEGTDDAAMPFLSPDGNAVGFFANGQIRRIGIDGTSPVTLAAAPLAVAGFWGEDGVIRYLPAPGAAIMAMPASGGSPMALVAPDLKAGEAGYFSPDVLPGGKVVLFTVEREGKGWEEAAVLAFDTEKRTKSVVLEGATTPRYLPDGRLLFHRGGRLMSIAFDAKTLRTTSDPQVVAENVVAHPGVGIAAYDVAEGGTIAYLAGGRNFFALQPTWFDRSGNRTPISVPPRPYIHPRLSPDEKRIAFQVVGANDDIWIYDTGRGVLSRLTTASENLSAEWSSDGTKLVMSSIAGDKPNLVVRGLDGTPGSAVPAAQNAQFATSWARDGRIALTEETGPTKGDIYIFDPAAGKTHPFLTTPFKEWAAAFSPDGEWLAYVSDESGQNEIYVRRSRGSSEKIQVSLRGGTDPVWARDGSELYFRSASTLFSVPVNRGSFGTPQRLFDAAFEEGQTSANYDVSKDGRRFLIVERTMTDADISHLQVIVGGR